MDDAAIAAAAAREGAAVVRSHFGGTTAADLKGRLDPVTAADKESEAAIVAVLREARPDDGILAEEGSGFAATGRRWIIDPLDGTVNFIHRIPQVAVSVALYDGDRAVTGVIIDPIHDEEFAATSGEGAFLDGTRIGVSSVTEPERAVVATGFPYDHDRHAAGYAANLGAVLAAVNGVRRFGAAALDLAWVAAGRFDGYWELGVSPWDIAAGILLVREAGGRATDLTGRDAVPETRLIVTSNGPLHEPLLDLVTGSLPSHLEASR
jgi:myo-inositol-1(or 4)-monophosphatase